MKKLIIFIGLIGIGIFSYVLFDLNQPETSISDEVPTEVVDETSSTVIQTTNYVIQIIHEMHSDLGVAYKVGSAVIINQDESYYYAVTNNHIMQDSDFESYQIIMIDYQNNEYIGYSMVENQAQAYVSELYDLHLIKFEKGLNLLANAPVRHSDLTYTEILTAIGYPEGIRTVTNGYYVRFKELSTIPFPLIEHSAEIQHGNSGGALIDSKGRVVGINVSGLFDGQGNYLSSYAIPSIKLMEYINLFRIGGDE